jgi:phosphoglycerol transferase MdoB-like AlkP superfamily enzyme
MDLPFMNSLHNQSTASKNHYAISPHTNQFISHQYSSGYTGSKTSFLTSLKENNYSTTFLASCNLSLWETKKEIYKCGFDNVIDRTDLQTDSKYRGDYLFTRSLNYIDDIQKQGPFFLQLLTCQTHYPYAVINKNKFNNHKSDGLKSKYLNAVEETDFTLSNFFEQLSQIVDLDNTLIIYLGDHGESFGELGYKAHSNSTINSQLCVPFILKHNLLKPQNINNSSHFDIMPTIIDLLGIEFKNYYLGTSIFISDKKLPNLFYSMVRKGNAPANVKIPIDGHFIMIDRVMDFYYRIDENDNIIRELNNKEKHYFLKLIFKMLSERGLIY